MSDGYEAEALGVAFRLATRFTAMEGVTKAAGSGYSRRLAAWAEVWMPLASGICENARRLDEHLEKVRRLYEQDQAVKAAATQTFDMSLGREPRGDVPYDPERFELRTELVPRVDGYGAAAPKEASNGQGALPCLRGWDESQAPVLR